MSEEAKVTESVGLFDDDFKVTAAPEPAKPTEQSAVIEIDLQDGSGVQRFVGNDYKEVAEKLAEAQRHATAKIRELSQQQYEPQQQQPVQYEPPPGLTVEEEWALFQQFGNNPSGTVRRYVEAQLGMSFEEVRQQLDTAAYLQSELQATRAAEEFIGKYPDYYATPGNAKKIQGYLNTKGWAPSTEAIEAAYLDLSQSGLLEKEQVREGGQQTAAPRQMASGISDSLASAGVPDSQASAVEDLYNIPLDELRARIVASQYAKR